MTTLFQRTDHAVDARQVLAAPVTTQRSTFSLHAANNIDALRHSVLAGPCTDIPAGDIRVALVDPSPERLQVAARIVARGLPHAGPRGIWFTPPDHEAPGGKCAFLFPGVDNRPPPRLDEVADRFPGPRRPLDANDPRDVLRNARQVIEGSILLDHAMRRLGVHPDGLLGLSCGEWAALTVAKGFVDSLGLLDPANLGLEFPDMVYLAAGIDGGQVRRTLDAVAQTSGVVVSHENAPSQCVACGRPDEIERLQAALISRGVFVRELPFRSGFHTPGYAPRVESTLAFLGLEAQVPAEEVWSCVTSAPFPADATICRSLLRRHFVEPVAFARSIRAMHDAGYRTFVELGTGSLTQMVTETLASVPHVVVPVAHHARPGDDGLLRALLALWVARRAVDPLALATIARPHTHP
jgi:acyl transferase domain-containing protein